MIRSTKVKDFKLHKYVNNPSVTSQLHAIFHGEFLTHSYNETGHNEIKRGYSIFIFIRTLYIFVACIMQIFAVDKVEVL